MDADKCTDPIGDARGGYDGPSAAYASALQAHGTCRPDPRNLSYVRTWHRCAHSTLPGYLRTVCESDIPRLRPHTVYRATWCGRRDRAGWPVVMVWIENMPWHARLSDPEGMPAIGWQGWVRVEWLAVGCHGRLHAWQTDD